MLPYGNVSLLWPEPLLFQSGGNLGRMPAIGSIPLHPPAMLEAITSWQGDCLFVLFLQLQSQAGVVADGAEPLPVRVIPCLKTNFLMGLKGVLTGLGGA